MSEVVELQSKLDAYKGARDLRLAKQKEVDNMKKTEDELKYELANYLLDNPDVNGIVGTTHTAKLVDKEVAIITDLSALQEFIVTNDSWDLVNLRLSQPAVRDRQEDNVIVPGIEIMTEHNLSIRKS